MSRPSAGAPTSQMARALLGLRELLFGGEYAPGQRLSELPLVERLGVSRTPLRLALARLDHEGLIEALATGGYVVRRFTRADIDDAIELRGVLEGTAARFAAERGANRRLLARMHALSGQLDDVVRARDEGVDSFVRYVSLNESFHELLVDLAAGAVLRRGLDGVLSPPFASPSAFLLAQAELPESRQILVVAQAQHRALLEAIEHREGARAESIAREHARLSRENLDVVLAHGEVRGHVRGASLIKLSDFAQTATRRR